MSLPGRKKGPSRGLLIGLLVIGGAVAAVLVGASDAKRYVRMRTM